MSKNNKKSDKDEQADEERDVGDLVLDLNFVPQWARKPADQNRYKDEKSGRDDRRKPRRNDRDRRPGQGQRPPRGDRKGGGRPPHGRHQREGRRGQPTRHYRVPVRISFVPERNRIGVAVNDIRESNHAYALQDVASTFLATPEYYLVKIEVLKGKGEEQRLYQCKETQQVFLKEDRLKAHCLKHVLDKHYEANEVDVEPPKGNFVCVSRCKLSGTLLGPPNHHSFKEQLEALHCERFSHMDLEDYRRQIETVRDPELIEKWKADAAKQTKYQPKEGESAEEGMTRAEAEEHFMQHVYPQIRHVANRMVISSEVSRNLEDRDLLFAIRDAWNKEKRNFFTLSIALRPAFKHMGLILFKVRGTTYVTHIPPKPIDEQHTAPEVQEILKFLREKPGSTRKELKAALRPKAADDAEEVNQLVHHLMWLIEKGHVIEFHGGKLALPLKAAAQPAKGPPKNTAKPQEKRADQGAKDPKPASPEPPPKEKA